MHKSRRTWPCFATLLISYSLFRITSSQALPSALQSGVPVCAQICVQDAVYLDFVVPSICTNSDDFDCLCSHYGSDGYTLGERAFGCLYSGNCTATSQGNATAIYTICTGQSNAVIPTHSTVVVTAISPTSTAGSTSTSSSPVPAMATTTSSSTATQASMLSSPTSGSQSSSTIHLTEAQVAGIAIASIALVVLTVGVAGCLLFVRRRNKNLEQEEAKLLFHHSRNASGSQTSHMGPPWKDPRGGQGGVGIIPLERSPRPDIPPPLPSSMPLERTWPRYYPIMPGDTFMPQDTFIPQDNFIPQNNFVPQESIGVAQTTNVPLQMPALPTASVIPIPPPEPVMVAPQADDLSRRSFSAAPDRPITYFGPQPTAPVPAVDRSSTLPSKRARRSIDPTAVLSQVTVFEEDGTRHSGLQSPGFPPSQAKIQDENRGRSENRPIVPALRTTSGSPRLRSLRPSTLKIQIPTYPNTTAGFSQPTLVATSQPAPTQIQQYTFPPPPPRAASRNQQPVSGPSNAQRPPSLYNKRSSPSRDLQQSPIALNTVKQPAKSRSRGQTATVGVVLPTTASVVRTRGPRTSGKSARKSNRSASEAGRDSVASYTSFETVGSDDDNPTPKEEDKELTPLDEGGSPISNLRYPKVPRSSNQAEPRTPPSPRNRESEDHLRPPKQSTPSPRNKTKATSPRGVVDQLWRTETRPENAGARRKQYATPNYQPAYKYQRSESRQQAEVKVGGKSSPPRTEDDQSGSWNWTPDQSQFNPKSPFGPMPKLTPTKQGEDLYLSVSRE